MLAFVVLHDLHNLHVVCVGLQQELHHVSWGPHANSCSISAACLTIDLMTASVGCVWSILYGAHVKSQ